MPNPTASNTPPANPPAEPEIIVTVRGGLVENIFARSINVHAAVLDYDNVKGADATDDERQLATELEAHAKDMFPVWG